MREDAPLLVANQIAAMYRAIDGRFRDDADGLEIQCRPSSDDVAVGFRGVCVACYEGPVDQYPIASAIRRSLKANHRSFLIASEALLNEKLRLPPGTELIFNIEQEMEFFDLATSTTHTFELRDCGASSIWGEIRIHSHKPGATLSILTDLGGGEERLLSSSEAHIVSRCFSGLFDHVVKMTHRAFGRYYARSGQKQALPIEHTATARRSDSLAVVRYTRLGKKTPHGQGLYGAIFLNSHSLTLTQIVARPRGYATTPTQ